MRTEARDHLAGRTQARPPLVAFVTDLSARLEHVDVDVMEGDAGLLTRSMHASSRLLRLPVLTLRWPQAGLAQAAAAGAIAGTEAASVLAEAVHRLRILVGDSAAVAVLLPGPATLVGRLGGNPRSVDDLEDAAADLLRTLKDLEPQSLDIIGVFEHEPVEPEATDDLADALRPIWNSAGYYAAAALFVAATADAAVARIGADAVAVLNGASAEQLLAAGVARVGVPVGLGDGAVPPLAPGGFYVTRGELAADAPLDRVTALVEAAR